MEQTQHDNARGALSVDDFCRTYALGKTFVYQQIKSGKLRAVKCGFRTLILRKDADRWAHKLPQVGAVS